MTFTHRIGKTYTTDAGTVRSASDTYQADGESNYEAAIPTVTNQEIQIAFDIADVQAFMVYSDQDITIHTNSNNGAGGDNIPVSAGVMLIWGANDFHPNPFTVDVTGMWFDNQTGNTANVRFRLLREAQE